LIAKEFSFFATTKSLEEYESEEFSLGGVVGIGERSIWRRCEFSGSGARKGVSGAGAYFMGYYTIWLAPVKKYFVLFWEISRFSTQENSKPAALEPKAAALGHRASLQTGDLGNSQSGQAAKAGSLLPGIYGDILYI
jgi:hypothetical protein